MWQDSSSPCPRWLLLVTERPVALPSNREGSGCTDHEIRQVNERLIRVVEQARQRAKKLPPGIERDALLKQARQAEITIRWLSSSEF